MPYYGNGYPATYQSPVQMPQQSYTPVQQPMQSMQPAMVKVMEWVEGEVGAKAFQMPAGWPPNQPIPLWDSTEPIIYLKSWGPMGIPNPLQKITYKMEEQPQQSCMLPGGQSGAAPEYATKSDFEQLRQEIRSMLQNAGNQNGTNNGKNQGGVRNG